MVAILCNILLKCYHRRAWETRKTSDCIATIYKQKSPVKQDYHQETSVYNQYIMVTFQQNVTKGEKNMRKRTRRQSKMVKTLLALTLAAGLALPGQAEAKVWNVGSQTEYDSIISSVQGGDTINVAPGVSITPTAPIGKNINLTGGTFDGGGNRQIVSSASGFGSISNAVMQNGFYDGTGGGGAIYIYGGFLTGGIHSSVFTGNEAGGGGGAIYIASGSLTGGIHNSVFTGNEAGVGGAIFWQPSSGAAPLTIDSSGSGVLFHGNKASSTPNSIHFHLANAATFEVTGSGTLAMYDPVSAAGTNSLSIHQTGSSTWILGGDNQTANTTWNIQSGTLLLTDDSPMTANAKLAGTSFTLASGATLLVTPSALSPAQIGTTGTVLDGNIGVGSDERYRAYIDPSAFSATLLTVDNLTTNNSTLGATAGSFGLGQYDYTYDGLAWNGSNLEYRVTSSALSAERNGVYAANAPLRSALANGTNSAVFSHLSDQFDNLRKRPDKTITLNLTTAQEEHSNVWGSLLNNNMKNDPSGNNAGSSVNTPGLIIGGDWQVNDNSFFGGAISATWPDYEQGRLEADGKDIRIALYGGTLLKGNWNLGYLASAGFGDMSHQRTTQLGKAHAKYDTSNYTLGLSLGKNIDRSNGVTLKPYLSYEYIRSLSDGYSETSNWGLSDITAGGQNNSVSRIKLGMNIRKDSKSNSYIQGGLYWQGLFGDREAHVTSFMNTAPGSNVRFTGAGMDKNALGLDLAIGKRVGRTDLSLSYNGIFGKNSMSNAFSVNFNYRF